MQEIVLAAYMHARARVCRNRTKKFSVWSSLTTLVYLHNNWAVCEQFFILGGPRPFWSSVSATDNRFLRFYGPSYNARNYICS
jgi:hypothetical protein